MGEAENRQTMLTVFRAIIEGNVGLFHEQFCEDSVIEFPQSGERIVGPRDRRSAVHQPEHCRVSPAEGVPEARREVAHAAREPVARLAGC